MAEYVVCIGSNTLSEEDFIGVLSPLSRCADIKASSSVSISPDVSSRSQLPYRNMVVRCVTSLPHEELRAFFSGIENDYGRTPLSKSSGIMPLDIDIVVADGIVISPDDFRQPYFRKGWEEIVNEG